MLELHEDNGTITVTLPGKETIEDGAVTGKGSDQAVLLRLPTLEELLDLWADLDKLAEDVRDAEGNIQTGVAMRMNAQWMRNAVAKLGSPVVYEKNGDGELRLTREDLAEPSWFVNGNAAASMLRQWQTVPLGPGRAA